MPDYNFTNVASEVKPVQQNSLSDMMNIARGAQAYQQAQQMNPLELQAKQQAVNQSQQMNPLLVQQQQAQTSAAQTGLNTAQLENMQKQQANSSRNLLKLLSSDEPVTPEKIQEHVTSTMKNAGASDQAIQQAVQDLPKTGTNKDLRAFLGQHALNSLTAEAQIDKLYPNATLVSTGAATVPVSGGGPLAVTAPGKQTGLGIETQLPPTTQVVGPSGASTYLGTQSQRPTGPISAGVGPATTNVQATLGTTLGSDWSTTLQKATDAPQKIAIYQNINKLIPESFTGALAEKKQFSANLAQNLGLDWNVMQSASTDELAKNTKLLALAGGNTDAARSLAELASPNNKMTKEGMHRVVNQLMGQENLNSAKANFLQDVSGDPKAYQNKLLQWSNASDPRFFQEMTQQDAQKMMSAMTSSELKALRDKKALAKQYGIIQ